MPKSIEAPGFILQNAPRIYVAAVRGDWLLKHSTPSWRIEDPEKGFQRIVREDRAQAIAVAVLNQGRTFPNAIVLATDRLEFAVSSTLVTIGEGTRFLVVDGQHRLWAQKFADHVALYACIIHAGLDEVQMARLFLEINDNQKRVPSSLRWDLVRLVRPDDDPAAIMASELVFELATNSQSPLYQRIDLTGEQGEIRLKQGSIAPELKSIVSTRKAGFRELDFDAHVEVLTRFLAAVRSIDPKGWRTGDSNLMRARVLRVLIRLLPEVVQKTKKKPASVPASDYVEYLRRIKLDSLATERIKAAQGAAGMKEIYDQIKKQMRV